MTSMPGQHASTAQQEDSARTRTDPLAGVQQEVEETGDDQLRSHFISQLLLSAIADPGQFQDPLPLDVAPAQKK